MRVKYLKSKLDDTKTNIYKLEGMNHFSKLSNYLHPLDILFLFRNIYVIQEINDTLKKTCIKLTCIKITRQTNNAFHG